MALVPIRAGRQIIGLLQLNDHRQGRFTDAIIAQLENIAAHIGGAVMRQQIEAALRVSLHEKESLLSEVHHRVKNNLQIISSLLRLQSGRINNSIAKAALLDMQNRIHSMALVHESLYDSASFAAVDFATYLRNLCNRLFRALVSAPDTIQLHLNIAPAHLDITRAIPCGLLVNELVTNALKHAFPQQRNGELRVELLQLDDSSHWRLRVADNGVGMPPDFDPNNLSSMGLKLVSDLSHQLGAQLKIGPGPGAVFEIDFPMPSK
jgi:two-component sensor histidine kinase